MGDRFRCKDCRYWWKSKKRKGRPAVCPRCNSRRIVFDCLDNFRAGWTVAIMGIFLFLVSFFMKDAIPQVLGTIGLIVGCFALIMVILGSLVEHSKDKKILEDIDKE